jgi:hypothetical protein
MQSAMKVRWPALAMLLLGAIALLAPLAYATPPDPTWVAGFWDDADFDDVILLITSTLGAVEAQLASDGAPARVAVATSPHHDERLASFEAAASPQPRAPPAA